MIKKLTREEKLWTKKDQDLIIAADLCGVKVKCNKVRTKIKEPREEIIARILKAEGESASQYTKETQNPGKLENRKPERSENRSSEKDQKFNNISDNIPNNTEVKSNKTTSIKSNKITNIESDKNPQPKRGAKIEYNGKSQNIYTWSKELGISVNTLYARIYFLGWSVEKAFTTIPKK